MDEEEVKYSYTGDVSSLRDATKEAISLLDKYESTVKSMAASNQLEVGKTAFTGFQRTVNGIIKQVNTLSSYMSKASEDSQQALAPDVTTAVSAYSDISDVLDFMQRSTKLTTEDVKLLTSVLQDTKATLDPLVTKATVLGSTFASVAQLTNQSMNSVDSTVEATEQHVSENVDSLGQKWDDYANRMSKSAEMSAQVFAQAGEFTDFTTGVDNAIAKAVLMRTQVEEAAAGMASSLQSMSGAFDPAIAKIQSYRDKASSMLGSIQKALNSISSAFRRVSQSTSDSGDGVAQVAEEHRNLSEAAQNLGNVVKSEQKALKQEKDTLSSKNKKLKESSKSHSGLSGVIQKLNSMFSSETSSVKSLTSSLSKMTGVTGLLHKVISRLTLVQIGRWLASAAKESIEYIENLNLFTVAMGDSVDQGLKFVDTMSEIYGMDPSNLYRYAGYFYQLTDAIGMTSEASAVLSLSLTKASNDIASLFNVDVQSVVENLASGMQGISRAVRKYGIDIRSVTLQQTALNYGITEQVESMSEANRMALRYLTMMEQVKNATSQTVQEIDGSTTVIGDFARNIETPANQLRIFSEQVKQLGRAIGNFLMPALKTVLPWINGVVMALRTALTTIATLLGFTESFPDSTSDISESASAIESIGTAASGATKQLKKMLGPFDELNVLSTQSDSGGGGGLGADDVLDPALEEAIKNMELSLDNVKMKAVEIRDTILSFFGFEWTEVFNPDTGEWEKSLQWFSDNFQQNLIDKFPQWSETITALFANWTDIMNGLSSVWQSLGSVVDQVFTKVSDFLERLGLDSTLAEGIDGLADKLENLASWIEENSDTIANFVLIIVALVTAFKGLSVISSVVSTISTLVSTVGGAISGFGSVLAIIAGVIAAIAILHANSESFATSFDNLMQTVWSSLQPMGEALGNLFATIGDGLQRLWTEHVQPYFEKVGNALAPALDTIGSLWNNISAIFVDVANVMDRTWTSTIEPMLSAYIDALGGVMEVFQVLWESVIGPVLEYIGDGLEYLWTQYLSPVVEDIIEIVGGLIELIMNLWNTVLQPLVKYIVRVFGPPIVAIIKGIWTVVETAVGIIGAAIQIITGALSGVIEFLNGVFTGDWKRALSGLANIFVALGNGIIGIIESVCNFGVGAINTFLSAVVGSVKGLINAIGGLIEDIAGFLGFDINMQVNWTIPQIAHVKIPRIPKVALANGGVVTRPTQALIGEGKYDEAVIPLGDSPQMKELVNQIADANSSNGNDDLVPVQIYMDGDLFYETMAKRARAARLRNGVSTF